MRDRPVPAPASRPASWFAAAGAVACTYFYFLIFAEFALLELARHAVPATQLRGVMAAMAGGGIIGAVTAAARFRADRASRQLRGAFLACAGSAALAAVATRPALLWPAATAAGLSLGGLTVVLASSLRLATHRRRLGFAIGLGTGLAYASSNVPAVFQGSATTQSLAAAGVALLGSALPRWMSAGECEASRDSDYARPGVLRWVLVLLLLVWCDSAAFYVIQHSAPLRGATWGGPAALWANAFSHLVTAVAAGVLLDRGARSAVAFGAMGALALGSLMLAGAVPGRGLAPWCYTAGVSLYSTVLVEYPARSGRPRTAAIVYAVAGWVGSGLGIGMAQDMRGIPVAFVITATIAVTLLLSVRSRPLRTSAALLAAAALGRESQANETDATIALGREVYIAEGCLHCHSQYVRPQVAGDVGRWGPATSLAQARRASPPLLGNRRQGPDLANVGLRRSPEWNRLHLIDPCSVSPGSRMPAYDYLFSPGNNRGDALVAYLASLGADAVEARDQQIAAWRPQTQDVLPPVEAQRLFVRLCAPCHGKEGRGDGGLAAQLSVRPPDWSLGFRRATPGMAVEETLARIIKFGLRGLPMAGHEYLPDGDVVGLARHVASLHKPESGARSPVQP